MICLLDDIVSWFGYTEMDYKSTAVAGFDMYDRLSTGYSGLEILPWRVERSG